MKYYKSCDELPLKIFCNISMGGNVHWLLLKSGDTCTHEQVDELENAWFDILIEFAQKSGDNQIIGNLQKEDQFKALKADYLRLQALFRYLKLVPDDIEMIEKAREHGYNIDPNNQKTIDQAIARSGHLKTRMFSIQAEVTNGQDITESKGIDFEETMAWLWASLQMQVPEDITVTRFLALKKQIKRKQETKAE